MHKIVGHRLGLLQLWVMGFALDTSVFVDNAEPFPCMSLGLDEAVIQVGSQEVDVTNAEVNSWVFVLHSYSVIESDI